MRQDRDYEDVLRRALAAAADSIEPGGDGLQLIRHRLDSRRSPRSVFSGFAEWLDLHGTRLLVRLDPLIEGIRGALRRAGPLSGPLLALAGFIAGVFSPRGRRRAGGHRGHASPPWRPGSAGAWLKPVFAVSAAVAIVMVGVVILNHEKGPLINPANSVNNASPGSSPSSGPSGGGTTASSKRLKLPLWMFPTQPSTVPGQGGYVSGTIPTMPAVACTATPRPKAAKATPTGKATATPTPTVSGTGTGTPTPQPTDTTVPTPTPTNTWDTGNTATATTAAMIVQYDPGAPAVVECVAPSPTSKPKPTQTP
jgi:hypothetical protein